MFFEVTTLPVKQREVDNRININDDNCNKKRAQKNLRRPTPPFYFNDVIDNAKSVVHVFVSANIDEPDVKSSPTP